MKLDGNGYAEASVTGTAVYFDLSGRKAPFTVSLYPPSGGATTGLVKFSTVTDAENSAAATEWEEWLPGTVSSATTYTFNGPITCLKATREAGAGTVKAIVRGA